MKLYELTERYQRIMDRIDDVDGEIGPEAEQELVAINDSIEIKTENICCLLKSFEAEAAAMLAESKRLRERAASKQRAYDYLERYLKKNLESMNLKKVSTSLFTASICRNSQPSVDAEGVDIDSLPPELVRTKKELSKSACVEWSSLGKELPAGISVRINNHLRIR